MIVESSTGVVVETTTTASSITCIGGMTTESSSQIGNDSMGDQGIVAQAHDGLLQQSAHLSSTLARRRADLALMRAEAATVAISLDLIGSQLRRETSMLTRVKMVKAMTLTTVMTVRVVIPVMCMRTLCWVL